MDQGLEQPGTSRGPPITGQAAGHGANGEGLVMGLETEKKPRWGGYLNRCDDSADQGEPLGH